MSFNIIILGITPAEAEKAANTLPLPEHCMKPGCGEGATGAAAMRRTDTGVLALVGLCDEHDAEIVNRLGGVRLVRP